MHTLWSHSSSDAVRGLQGSQLPWHWWFRSCRKAISGDIGPIWCFWYIRWWSSASHRDMSGGSSRWKKSRKRCTMGRAAEVIIYAQENLPKGQHDTYHRRIYSSYTYLKLFFKKLAFWKESHGICGCPQAFRVPVNLAKYYTLKIYNLIGTPKLDQKVCIFLRR